MTRIETTKDVLYHFGHDKTGDGGERSTAVGVAMNLAVRDLARRVQAAALQGPVTIVAV